MKIGDRVRNKGFLKKWTGRIIARNGHALLINKDQTSEINTKQEAEAQVWYLEHEIELIPCPKH